MAKLKPMQRARLAAQKGFTMIEVMVVMAIITLITMTVLGALEPWMNFKMKLDTERKLQDVKQGFLSLYESNAFELERNNADLAGFVTTPGMASGAQCTVQDKAFAESSDFFSESGPKMARDGYSAPWCISISPQLSTIMDGAEIYYRNVHIVSTGLDGVLDADTHASLTGTGPLKVGGDDVGITISGRDIHYKKLQETLRRLDRLAVLYETSFTAAYLMNPARDVTKNYFLEGFNVASDWIPVQFVLSDLGTSSSDISSAWDNPLSSVSPEITKLHITNANSTPAKPGDPVPRYQMGQLPYTAVLRARLPGPDSANNYAYRVVVGGY